MGTVLKESRMCVTKLLHSLTLVFIHCSKLTCFHNPIHHRLSHAQHKVSMDFNLSCQVIVVVDWDCTCTQCLRRVKGLFLLIGHFKYLLTYLLTYSWTIQWKMMECKPWSVCDSNLLWSHWDASNTCFLLNHNTFISLWCMLHLFGLINFGNLTILNNPKIKWRENKIHRKQVYYA